MIINSILLILLATSANANSFITVDSDDNRIASASNLRVPIATSDCLGAAGADARGQFFGLGFVFNKSIKECNCRENAKVYKWLGAHMKAVKAMDDCKTERHQKIITPCPYPSSCE
jgi:hypothetical protein